MMRTSNENTDPGIARPVAVLFAAHLLSGAVWFYGSGRLGIPPWGLPALFFAWPAAVALVLLIHRRVAALHSGTSGAQLQAEKVGRLRRLAGRTATYLPHILLATSCLLVVLGLVFWFRSAATVSADHGTARLVMVLAGGSAFVLFFLIRWAGAAGDTESNPLRSLLGLSWLGVAVHALSALTLALRVHAGIEWFPALQNLFALLLIALLCEALLLAVFEFYRPAARRGEAAPGTSPVLGWIMARSNPAHRIAGAVEAGYGVKLGDIWALQFLKRLLLPLVIFGVLVVWLATSLTMIPAESEGVRVRMGRFVTHPLGPGLHVGLPWPFEEVVILPTRRVEELHLGYDVDLGGPVLWNERHYEGERNMLADNGETLLTVSLLLHYRISDPVAYVTHASGHREALTMIGYRELLHTLAARDSFGVMIDKRGEFAEQMSRSIQADADELGLGIEVVFIGLRDIHPPVDVAPAYQDVISAEELRHTLVNEGRLHQQTAIPLAKRTANRMRAGADGYAKARVAFANGDAVAFESLAAAFAEAPELLRRERWLQALEDALFDRPKLITGRTGDSEGEPIYLDFRYSGAGMSAGDDTMIEEE